MSTIAYTRAHVLALRAAHETARNDYNSVARFNTDPARRAELPRLEAIADAAYAELCRVRDIVAASDR